MPKKNFEQLCTGFSKLERHERLTRLHSMGLLSEADIQLLTQSTDKHLTATVDKFIENVIGCFPMPLGVATNFKIDGKDYVIPMVVEESSVVAAASRAARWVREKGRLSTQRHGNTIIGQIHITGVNNNKLFSRIITAHKKKLIESVNTNVLPNLLKRGGGVKDIIIRDIHPNSLSTERVVHVLLDSCDAMGANAVTQACEYLKKPIKQLTGTTPKIAVVSNLTDTQLTCATIVLNDIDPALAESIEEASTFADNDPYRAATHNKGVLNGIDAVLIATGNDWRAVDAGIHAYAARHGHYQPIARWRRKKKTLVGTLEAPIIVGTVGGVTSLHPFARLCLNMLGNPNAKSLSRLLGAVGLVQNLAALHALTTGGITQGHMKLHINNLLLWSGAKQHEETALRRALETLLATKNKISLTDAKTQLHAIRNNKKSQPQEAQPELQHEIVDT